MNQSKSKDPQISWQKQTCPFCGKPTGTDTKCEETSKRRLVSSGKGIILPIFAEDCTFKKINSWIGTVNYKLTSALVKKISDIDGVENIECNSLYTFTVSIAKLHNSEQVCSAIAIAYRSYIKERLALTNRKDTLCNQTKLEGIIMPNGIVFNSSNDYDSISELVDRFDRVGQEIKKIVRKE